MKRLLTLLALLPGLGLAQVSHPRIWLDSTNLTRLQTLYLANDSSWSSFKAHADAYLTVGSPPYGYLYKAAYASGGTFSGTGSCNVVFSANSSGNGINAIGTLDIRSGTPASSITITQGGSQYYNSLNAALAPTSAILSSGTATCSGAIIINATVNNTVDTREGGSSLILYTYGLGASYQGNVWYDSLFTLGLAYKVTGSISYANKAMSIMDSIAASGVGPISVDHVYSSRNIPAGFALAYDWVYDQISADRKVAYSSIVDIWWAAVKLKGGDWQTPVGNGCSNYFAGHVFGFGLAAIAFEGDDPNATAIMNDPTWGVLTRVNSIVIPQFSRGCFAGGVAPESYNYGTGTFIHYWEFFWGMQTAGKSSQLIDPSTGKVIVWLDYVKSAARATLYNMRPDLWAIADEGDWPGSYSRVLSAIFPYELGLLLDGTIEGTWINNLYNNMSLLPGSTNNPFPISSDPAINFLFKQISPTDVNYATLPLSYYSLGDYHSFVRTDWTKSAVHTIFNAGTQQYTGHQMLGAGNVTIQRGQDYLLVNAGQWKGADGYVGSPSTFSLDSVWLNTLSVTDIKTNCIVGSWYGQGCQSPFHGAGIAPVAHFEGNDYTFSEADLRYAYWTNSGISPFSVYHRTFLNIGGVSFVFDRATLVDYTVATRKLLWHFPANATAALTGSVEAISKGSSTLWIDTLLPSNASITTLQDMTEWGGSTPNGTKRIEVSDPNATSTADTRFLTVLTPTESSVTTAPTTSLISTEGFIGVAYNDGALPRIALFSGDGTSHSSVSYSAIYSGTGRHVILNLRRGLYVVSQNGAFMGPAVSVGSDGSLSFTAVDGGNFSVRSLRLTGLPRPPVSGPVLR
jgi:hypothetical protein